MYKYGDEMDKFSTMPDKELVALFKEGLQPAFVELYVRYEKKLINFCKGFLKDGSKAEDIIQDIFLQILETPDSLNTEKSFYGYLQTIAKNRVLYEARKSNIHLRYEHHAFKHGNDVTNQTEDMILDNDYEKLLNEMIDGLTPQQKEVFRLSRLQGLTYNEIAETMHISLRTVKKHASLALEKIKNQLMEHADIHFKTIMTLLLF